MGLKCVLKAFLRLVVSVLDVRCYVGSLGAFLGAKSVCFLGLMFLRLTRIQVGKMT